MTLLFILILFIHGLIHLIGYLKAYSLADLPDIRLSVSRPAGTLWLAASILFMGTAIVFYFSVNGWWAGGILAVVLSQGLVISAWRDAKFATIPNLIILLVSVIACANWLFDRNVEADIKRILSEPEPAQNAILTSNAIEDLPPPVQHWMERSGAVGYEKISRVRLKQTGEMKTEPGQNEWADTEAEQVFNVAVPSFVWAVEMEMMPMVTLSGQDLFVNGKGHMLIKLYSLISVVDEKGDKIDRGTLQRFLSEIVWFPTAAINDYIEWEIIDSTAAEAVINWQDISEKVRFHFSENGDVKCVTADRYMGGGEAAERRPWEVTVLETSEVDGLRIPTEVEVSWELDSGTFTWYRFLVTDIDYDYYP
ncbi:DUF6544 family protein [Rhodohalobacter sp. 8-1]|uniref:DUF6544 family protein n=1 Tax=Rhodohalobacter sp. 8-1 TaxID=3131972 RepID=UPI0030EDAA26